MRGSGRAASWKAGLATIVLLAGAVAVMPPPVAANHNTCAGDHPFFGHASGTVSSTNRRDFWRHPDDAVVHQFILDPAGGDADLLVYRANNDCEDFECGSFEEGGAVDRCTVVGTGLLLIDWIVEVQWWEGTSVSYDLWAIHGAVE